MTSKDEISIEDDTRILQNIFPNEVWQLIFNNIHLPADYTRISNSSPGFKYSLLLPHWNRVVFPKILDLIELQCLGYHTREGRNALLNLRLVCSAWKWSVDTFLQNVPEHFLFEEEMDCGYQRNDPRPKKYRAENEFRPWGRLDLDVTSFRETFDETHLPQNINPLVNRQLQIGVDLNLSNWLEHLQATVDLLRDYGCHVWYLKLSVYLMIVRGDLERIERFDVGNCIRDILSLLPSLRTLRFTFIPDLNGGAGYPPWKQKLAEMQEHWTRKDMPHFPNLSFLGEIGLPWPMLMALLRANTQLTSLESGSLTTAATSPAPYETQMPINLKHLSIEFLELRQLEILEAAKVNWKLEKLCLRARGRLPMDYTLQLARVMRVAESKFGQTLRRLYVLCRQQPNVPVAPVRIPNLEFYHLLLLGMAPELNFLSPVGSTLKTLFVELPQAFFAEEQGLRYQEQISLPRQDNLWEMLPKLQKFSVMIEPERRRFGWHNVTREQWEWKKNEARQNIQTYC